MELECLLTNDKNNSNMFNYIIFCNLYQILSCPLDFLSQLFTMCILLHFCHRKLNLVLQRLISTIFSYWNIFSLYFPRLRLSSLLIIDMHLINKMYYIGCPHYNTGCPYSDMGTEYGHPRYLWN